MSTNDIPEDLFPQAEIPLEAQIKCVQREITFRKRVYARRVSLGRMSEVFADQQIKLMNAVLETLIDLRQLHETSDDVRYSDEYVGNLVRSRRT